MRRRTKRTAKVYKAPIAGAAGTARRASQRDDDEDYEEDDGDYEGGAGYDASGGVEYHQQPGAYPSAALQQYSGHGAAHAGGFPSSFGMMMQQQQQQLQPLYQQPPCFNMDAAINHEEYVRYLQQQQQQQHQAYNQGAAEPPRKMRRFA